MTTLARPWDYLIVTASNDRQAAAYEAQLELRGRLNMLSMARDVLVVPDPQGRRVGSGGSTVSCLLEVLNREAIQTKDLEKLYLEYMEAEAAGATSARVQ